MAELLGIVAGGAGLASLALQLVDGGQKLRQRYKNVKGLGGNLLWLSEDIELIGKQLIQLEASADDIMQEQLGPIMMGRCRDRCARVADRMANLAGYIPENPSRRHIVRTTFRSSQWKGELDELQALVTGLKQDISQLYIVQQHLYMRDSRKSLATVGDTPSETSIVALSTETASHDISLGTTTASEHRIVQYSTCSCGCSCHKKRTINGMFWHLQYSPLAEIFKACDNPACSVRRYRFDLRLTLYRYGIPLKAALGFDLITAPGLYSLQPCLQVEAVVDFDTPGFVILGKLASDEIGWETAETMFRDLYKSCPGFVNQLAFNGSEFRYFDLLYEPEILAKLVDLFANSFHTKETTHSVGLLKRMQITMRGNDRTHFVNSLTTLVCDFKNDVPTWGAQPPLSRFIMSDPFDFQFTKLTLKANPDFGDSPPLHASILFDSDIHFKHCLERVAQPFEKIVNFMGQSALHMGVCQPSRVAQLLAAGHPVDLGDKNGVTPLMYAASMNVLETMVMLVEKGANLFATGEKDLTVPYVLVERGNWDLIWQIVDFVSTSYPGLVPELFRSLLSCLSSNTYETCYTAHDPSGLNGCTKFSSWVISNLGSPNFYFDDGTTLMHMTNDSRSARALIDLGFTEFKQKDGALLEHLVSLSDLSLFRFAVGNGGGEHLHNDWSWDILNAALGGLATNSHQSFPDVLGTLQFLLDGGIQVVSRDGCVCNCSAGGCLPGLCLLPIKLTLRLFAWLEILEKKRDAEEAKKFSLALLRQMCFNQAGLHHTCSVVCNSDSISDTDSDRFWDIPEQIRVDELNQEMAVLAAKAYSELKIEAMICLRRVWEKEDMEQWPGPQLAPRTWRNIQNNNSRKLSGLLEEIRTSKQPQIPEPLSSSWERIVHKKIKHNNWMFRLDHELAVVEFGVDLYRYGGDQFESWLPLLTQLTDVLLAQGPGVSES